MEAIIRLKVTLRHCDTAKVMAATCPGGRATLFEYVLRWMNYGLDLVDLVRNMNTSEDDDVLYGWAPVEGLSLSETMLAEMSCNCMTMIIDDPRPTVGLELGGLGPR